MSLELLSALASYYPKSAYDEVRSVFNKWHPDSPLHSYWVIKRRLEGLSGITQIELTCVPTLVLLSQVLLPIYDTVLNVPSHDMIQRKLDSMFLSSVSIQFH